MILSKNKYVIFIFLFFAGFFISGRVFADSDNIVGIVFTSEEQSIAPGTPSDTITIQTQNASGGAEKLSETSDLYLSASPESGEFSSNASNWQSVDKLTMSSSSENRNFYYKNDSAGQYTLTARLVGRTSGREWTATQNIYVGTDVPAGDSSSDTSASSSSSASSSGSVKTLTHTVYISTHSDPEDLSDSALASPLAASAGRERLSYVGVPVVFSAGLSGAAPGSASPMFSWSFGDGFSLAGSEVSHAYKYPGVYNVVLNASDGVHSAVSRTKVTVLAPDILLAENQDGGLAVSNLGKDEINLGGWSLTDKAGEYIFPRDTILDAGAAIIISAADAHVGAGAGKTIFLDDPSGNIAAEISPASPAISSAGTTTLEETLGMSVGRAEALVGAYRSLAARNDSSESQSTDISPAPSSSSAPEPVSEDEAAASSQTAAASAATPPSGFWHEVVSAPLDGLRALGRLFYNW